MINDKQTAATSDLVDILSGLQDGGYGKGDELDVDALREDLDDVTADKTVSAG